jgi:DNA-binding NarL/FixJ family response regulator
LIDNELHTEPERSPGPADRTLIALCPDLFFASKIRATASAVGRPVRQARDSAGVLAAVAEAGGAARVLVDLTAARDALEAIAAVKAAHPPVDVIAFARHDDTEAILGARRAGADRVMARSAFAAALPAILRGE